MILSECLNVRLYKVHLLTAGRSRVLGSEPKLVSLMSIEPGT